MLQIYLPLSAMPHPKFDVETPNGVPRLICCFCHMTRTGDAPHLLVCLYCCRLVCCYPSPSQSPFCSEGLKGMGCVLPQNGWYKAVSSQESSILIQALSVTTFKPCLGYLQSHGPSRLSPACVEERTESVKVLLPSWLSFWWYTFRVI